MGGGLAASIILIAFGVTALVMGYQGRNDVRDTLRQENIVGTQDSSIAGQRVDTGSEAKAFADVMRNHTLERTGGKTYAELERYVDTNGQPTNDANAAARNPAGGPADNPLRQLWVTETALSTALNTAYFAEQVANFALVMGLALTLTGVGFLVLTLGALRHAWATDRAVERVEGRAPAGRTLPAGGR
jgi:hypothetical protein